MDALLFKKITKTLVIEKKHRIIGISGVDTSGKTMFADQFARYLDAVGISSAALHMDDFHNPSAVRRQGSDEVDAYFRNAFDAQRVMRKILMPLREEGCLEKDLLCLGTVLLIEGGLLFRSPIDEYLDGRIFLHIGFDEVLRRAALRDVPKYGEAILARYQSKYIPAQQKYLRLFRRLERSDFVIDNTSYDNPVILSIK